MAKRKEGHPEFTLLCLAAHPRPDLKGIRALLRQGFDDARLLELAQEHGVRPGLIQCLSALSWEGVPNAARESLEIFQSHHLLRTLALANELRRLAILFAQNGIAFAAFKGPALALSLYGGLPAREYDDIDIVVREAQMPDAERLLATLGYRCRQGDEAYRRRFLGYQRQYDFVRDEGVGSIDLHWGFSGTHVPFPLTPAEIWDDLQFASIADYRVPMIDGANLALLLAGHGTKDRWRSLKWVCDFALLLDRRRDLDWSTVHRRASAHGCGDAVLLGCAMAHEMLQVPPPAALGRQLADSGRVRALTDCLAARLRNGPWREQGAENFSDFDLCERPLDRLKATLKLVFTPTPSDHAALPLPSALWPVYYATRPFRLAAKLLAGPRH